VPDNSYADGIAATGYDTPEQFKYEKGDIVARSPGNPNAQAVGQTNYTISYMIKASNITPAGFYVMNHDLGSGANLLELFVDYNTTKNF
jgi:hypothetical protein